MSVKERLKYFIKYLNIRNADFERSIGAGNAYVQNISKGIGSNYLEKIREVYPDLNIEWLLTGKGEMLRSEVQTEVSAKTYPLLSLEAFAGYGDTEVIGEELSRITERYEIPLFRGLNVDFMISVKGSSMYPKYNSGDVVACRLINELTFVQWNKVYVIDTFSQGIILKRLKPSENEKTVICKSDNESYDAFELPKKEIRKIAMVVGVVRLE